MVVPKQKFENLDCRRSSAVDKQVEFVGQNNTGAMQHTPLLLCCTLAELHVIAKCLKTVL